jgi:radical SAM superfamily enzyme YgiQ (UPF0313 family)
MKVTLLTFDEEVYCLGVRLLSAHLKKEGYCVKTIFITPEATSKLSKYKCHFSTKLLNEIYEACKDSDLIGMSLITNQFVQASDITRYLRDRGISSLIVWGGIEPTIEPEVCLEYADVVCVGEGEDALLELVRSVESGLKTKTVKNMFFKDGTEIIRNEMRPLNADLDRFPLPDYSCENHYIAHGDTFEALTRERLIAHQGERFRFRDKGLHYPIMTSRGCPFACTYCCNSIYKKLYPKDKLLRWRSTDSVIAELKMIQEKVAPLEFVYFVDDNFTSRSVAEIEAFCKRYKEEINIPFFCQVSPLTIDEERMEVLFRYGCAKVTMGVETGNKRVAKMYKREKFHEAVPRAIALIEKYRSRMVSPPTYQFIIDNPFETIDEMVETLHFAADLPQPWNNPIYSLMLFPGSELYDRACSEGIMKDKHQNIYGRNWLEQSRPYFQLWVRLYRANCPRWVMKAMLAKWVVFICTAPAMNFIWNIPVIKWIWKRAK